jgi:putative ABC transport system permease protein
MDMAQLLEYIKMAVDNIKSNKGRSLLTMLGIIIGIASVIMIMAVGSGVKNQMSSELNAMANGQVYIYQNAKASVIDPAITIEDMEALSSKLDDIKGLSPYMTEIGIVNGQRGQFDLTVNIGTADFVNNSTEKMVKGKYFSADDVLIGRKVCVINKNDAIRLFGSIDVVGMDIELSVYGNTQDATIIGIRDVPESSSITSNFFYADSAIQVDMPYTSMESFGISYEGFGGLMIYTEDGADTKRVASQAVKLLEARHQSYDEDLFLVQDLNDSINQVNSTMDMMTTFISIVAAISLLVGGIGVMNIMLVSVTERTREIGIRKALGAKTGSIMMQFLMESAIITALGGIIGILLGIGGAYLICSMPMIGVPPGIKVSTIITATIFSTFVGVFFGIYPARKAAKMSPIEALRRN